MPVSVSSDNPLGIDLSPETILVGDSPQGKRRRRLPLRLVWSSKRHSILLYHANSLTMMDRIHKAYPNGFVDVIFADPPYFLSNGGITCHAGKMVKVDKGEWDKSMGPRRNHEFNFDWLMRCQRVLKPNGTIWVSGTSHAIHSVGFAMQELGYKILNDVTWVKPNPPPNLSCRYLTHATETIIWAAKSAKSKHYYDYAQMKEIAGGKQMKSVWELPPPRREEKKHGKHPTQKPIALLKRILLNDGDADDPSFDGRPRSPHGSSFSHWDDSSG